MSQIYSSDLAVQVTERLKELIGRYRWQIPVPVEASLSEHDVFLITYADQVHETGTPPLQTLSRFCQSHLRGIVNDIHILPFYPWSSDDGFAVMDYRSVDARLGDWQDVEQIGTSFRLMFDGVINHVSVHGEWFQAYLRDDPPYREYFLDVEGNPDLSQVIRPRALPLLTTFQTVSGERRVWTTFSADQADLDYHNPDVLLEMLDILLMYVCHGAQFIRLDAVAYLWKEIGTTCIHLPQTHAIIQLLRAVLDEAAPHVQLITETNVPHAENISYFGDGYNEAQLVYNFALPPLVLHTIRTGDASILSQWAAGLDPPTEKTSFFNFLASHDGIGLNPARGILYPTDIDELVGQCIAHGGLISYKQNSDGTNSPYELNINYFDALSNPSGGEPLEVQIDRFMAAQAIMLSLKGVPAVYFHSLFGSRGWREGVQTGLYNRAINRQKLELGRLEGELADEGSLRFKIFKRYQHLLLRRAASTAFHPHGRQTLLDAGRGVFALMRLSPNGEERFLCLQNVTRHKQVASLPGCVYTLEPYQTLWQPLETTINYEM